MKRKLVFCTLLGISRSAFANELDENYLSEVPVILSATKLEQSLYDVPGSVTVISAEQIRLYGITNIPEALRYVPGMLMTQASGNDYRVNYHGTNGLVPRRMQILVDGVSVYRNGLARIDWLTLPIPVENIEKIEVIRNPSGATYGSNSYQAVVNIVSKSASTQLGFEGSVLVGSQSTKEAYLRYGSSIGRTDFYFSAKTKSNDGFDTSVDENASREFAPNSHDDAEASSINFYSSTELSENSELIINAGFVDANLEYEHAGGDQLSFPDVDEKDYLIDVKLLSEISNNHSLQLSGYFFEGVVDQGWRTCAPGIALTSEMREMFLANPDYVNTLLAGQIPTGGTAQDDILALAVLQKAALMGDSASQPACGDTNHDIKDGKAVVELQDTYVFSDRLRAVSALGYGYYYSDAQTYLGGKVDHERYYFFTNAEYKPFDKATVNAGFMVERETTLSNATNVSPRLGLNYLYLPDHVVKLVYSQGRRTPDILESDRYWTYTVTNLSPPIDGSTTSQFYTVATPTAELEPEKIESFELIFAGNYRRTLQYDVKFFREDLKDLISEKLTVFNYNPSNSNAGRLEGIEIEFKADLTNHWGMQGGYAYIDSKFSNDLEQTLHADHSGFIATSYKFKYALTALTFISNSGVGGNSYDRLEMNVSNDYALDFDHRLKWGVKVSHLFSDNISSIEDVGERVVNAYDESTHYSLSLGIAF